MICTNCGTENVPGAKFCTECGTALAVVCPACGTPNAPGAKFCSQCATPLVALAPAAKAQSPAAGPTNDAAGTATAERRLVSVLFNDLVGFTPFSEGRDAEEVRGTLSRSP